jgi:beta-lactamase regulating signal transducer with metallopeptidase domain
MDLTALQHSAFLQSLGWAIANSIWQAAILWGLFHIINALYRNSTSKFRNNSATVFLFSSFSWFLFTFVEKFVSVSNGGPRPIVIHETQVEQLSAYINQSSDGINWQQLLTDASTALPYLSMAYLLLLIIFTTRWFGAYRHTNFIRRYGLQKPDVDWRLFTDKAALHIGIHRKINIWFSEYVDVPATIGYLKPIILIPLASLNQLTVQQLEAIILHELAHIKRNDYLINLVTSVIEIVMFFNPFVGLLAKVMKRERENCCDDYVIQYQYDRLSYASALLSIEQYRLQQHKMAMAATSNKNQLLGRVRRIMENNPGHRKFNYGQKLMALLIITGVICSIAWLSPADQERLVTEKADKDQIILNTTSGNLPKVALKTPEKGLPVPELATELRKTFTSKELAELNDYFEEKIEKDLKPLAKTIKKELKTALPENIVQAGPDIKNLKVAAPKRIEIRRLIPSTMFTHPGNSQFSFTFNSPNTDEMLKSLTTYVDIKQIQADIQRSQKDIASLDWRKIESEIRSSIENMQKELNQLGPELKQHVPTIKQLLRSEVIKAQHELAKLRAHQAAPHGESRPRSIPSQRVKILRDSIALIAFNKAKDQGTRFSTADYQQTYYDKTVLTPGTGGTFYRQAVPSTTPLHTWGLEDLQEVEVKGHDSKKNCEAKAAAKAKSKMNIEFKDGLLYIDGESIRIQDIKDQPAVKLKDKHIRVITKNNDQIEIRIGS